MVAEHGRHSLAPTPDLVDERGLHVSRLAKRTKLASSCSEEREVRDSFGAASMKLSSVTRLLQKQS